MFSLIETLKLFRMTTYTCVDWSLASESIGEPDFFVYCTCSRHEKRRENYDMSSENFQTWQEMLAYKEVAEFEEQCGLCAECGQPIRTWYSACSSLYDTVDHNDWSEDGFDGRWSGDAIQDRARDVHAEPLPFCSQVVADDAAALGTRDALAQFANLRREVEHAQGLAEVHWTTMSTATSFVASTTCFAYDTSSYATKYTMPTLQTVPARLSKPRQWWSDELNKPWEQCGSFPTLFNSSGAIE